MAQQHAVGERRELKPVVPGEARLGQEAEAHLTPWLVGLHLIAHRTVATRRADFEVAIKVDPWPRLVRPQAITRLREAIKQRGCPRGFCW